MNWVFLSPHFDDAAFSAGGFIWERLKLGESVQIWTVCAGEIPSGELSCFAEDLHRRWAMGAQTIEGRRDEDDESCERLGAIPRRMPIPDCIYRRAGDDYWNPTQTNSRAVMNLSVHLYSSEEDIFGDIHPAEANLIDRLCEELVSQLPKEFELVSPLTVGRHVDHQLVRAAAEKMGRPLWYYADVPYVLEDDASLDELINPRWEKVSFPISSAGLDAWLQAVSAYASQISTFWADSIAIRSSIKSLIERYDGYSLWKSR